ncbi:MAG: BBP7 family outer membrane beta-barrel protein [Pirellulaceae bacterium]
MCPALLRPELLARIRRPKPGRPSEPCCDPSYFARVGGLVFTRDRPRFRQISFDDTDLVGQVLSTHSGLGRWDAGGQVDVGWQLTPTCTLTATYWGLFGEQVTTTVYAANLTGNLNTAFDLQPLNITGSGNVNDDLFDAAHAHRIRRDYEVHNVEVNLLSGPLPTTAGGRLQASYLAGVRYLRFTEDFHYAAAQSAFGVDPVNEGYYDINVGNDLWGVQLGGRADWFVTPRFSIYTAPKFGVFGNYMEHASHIHNINGSAIVGSGNPLAGEAFDISSNRTEVSFVGEIDVGFDYQFSPCLGAALGYRALAISGLAYATDQIPNHFADLPGVAAIDHNADLILHGGYANVTVTW